MITKSFDNITKEIITPDDTISQREKELARSFQIDTFIISFSHKLVDLLYENGFSADEIEELLYEPEELMNYADVLEYEGLYF